MQRAESKKNWAMTSSAFARLLEWLDDGENSDGGNYLEMRTRLVAYFDRKNRLNADELADETLNRVARRLEEEGAIKSETPARYCYITAKFVFLESLRRADEKGVSLDDALRQSQSKEWTAEADEEKELKERMLVCLEECAAKLEAASREIIFNYYYGEERVKIENRRRMAEKMAISTNALTIRACRIREKLEGCVGKCANEK